MAHLLGVTSRLSRRTLPRMPTLDFHGAFQKARQILCLCLWSGLPFVSCPAGAQTLPSDAEIRTILQNYIEHDHWGVGIVVGIVDQQGTRVISYGKLDNGDSPEVNGDTLFEIGSITKTFTCLLLEDMIQRGEMKLDDPVEKYLPASVKVPAWGKRKITLQDLATHTSGLPRDLDDWSFPGMYKFLSQCRLLSKPGTKVLYSNFGVALLAHAIELKAGTNYEALVQQRICQPLGMSSTGIQPRAELTTRWAKSHGDENRTIGDCFPSCDGLGGAGAIRSSINDLLKYAAAEMGLTNSPLLPLMEKTHIVRIRRAFGEADLALPWWIYHWDGSELITHGGNTGGQTAFLGFDKKPRRAVVVLANRNDFNEQSVQPLGFYLLHPPPTYPVAVPIAPEKLDAYAGLYQFTDLPLGVMLVCCHGDRLNTSLLNSSSGDWLPQSDVKFTFEWGWADMNFYHSLTGQRRVQFSFRYRVVAHARKISDDVSDSLMQPMFQPLAGGECSPRPGSDLQGTWEGSMRPWFWPFHTHHGTIRIAEPSPGVFRAELDYPEQQASKLPVSVIYHEPRVELVLRSGDTMFKGTINRDHTKMAGSVFQEGHSMQVTIRRADPKPAVAAKAGS